MELQLDGAEVAETALACGVGAAFFVRGFLGPAGSQAQRKVDLGREEIAVLKAGGLSRSARSRSAGDATLNHGAGLRGEKC